MRDHAHEFTETHLRSRRDVLKTAAAMVAAPLAIGASSSLETSQAAGRAGTTRSLVRAYGASSATSAVAPMQIERRALGPNDVRLAVLYSGICHSDIHIARSDWRPAKYPIVPGHEIIGRVQAVGSAVTKFKVGDIGGVGCMVDSCGTCENCQAIVSRTV